MGEASVHGRAELLTGTQFGDRVAYVTAPYDRAF